MTDSVDARVGLAVNPTAAFGKGAGTGRRVRGLLESAGLTVVDLSGRDINDCRARIRAAQNEIDALVIVGGDGMVHLAIGEVAELPLGVVPSGTGNDFARSVGIELGDVDAAVARIVGALSTGPTAVDLLEVTHRDGVTLVAGALSVGFDALVNRIANAIKARLGPFKYQLAVVLGMFRFRAPTFRVSIDGGEVREAPAMLMTATLNPSIGGGMRIVPDASRRDGLLSVFEVAKLSKIKLAILLPRLITASHVNLPQVTITRAQSIDIDTSDPVVGMGDGEHVGLPPFRVRVRPGALRVLI